MIDESFQDNFGSAPPRGVSLMASDFEKVDVSRKFVSDFADNTTQSSNILNKYNQFYESQYN